tara:strand:+ start:368 stop:1159 length:792 start_codon:yes stop_codon:yes gene_type:complete
MVNGNLSILHSLGYVLLAILLWKSSERRSSSLILSGSLVLLHGFGLLLPWFTSTDFEFGLFKAFVWIMWLAAVLVCCEAFFRRIVPKVMAPIFVLTGIAILLDSFFPSPNLANDLSLTFRFHILIAMLSYSCLFFTSIRALTINFQENSLRNPKTRLPDLSLPSLIELDASLHRLLLVTFLLLSGTVMSGIFVNLESGRMPLIFDHKTFFSLLAWLLISCIVAGKLLFGWRGRMVAKMTMIGCFLVILSYLGTQFVIEVILNR